MSAFNKLYNTGDDPMVVETIKYTIKTVAMIFLIVFVTHTLFFIVFSYFACGDAFLALKNFYYLTYGVRI